MDFAQLRAAQPAGPALASIITGLYPHQHKVTSNDPPLPARLVRTL